MSSVILTFPDQTYTTANKPSVETLKTDLSAIETGLNDLQDTAVLETGTQAITGVKTMTTPVLISPVISAQDGWNTVTDTWTYASATTITVPTGAASLYKKGDKFKLTANSVVLQGYIVTVADTLLTTVGDALTNHAFTGTAVSHAASPIGFPDSFTFAGAVTNFAATPTTSYRFSLDGTICNINVTVTGTASNTTHAITLPIAAESSARIGGLYTTNNTTSDTGRADTTAGSTTLSVFKDAAANAWTNSVTNTFHIFTSYIID